MSKNKLVVESGKHLVAKLSGVATAFALECASDPIINGSPAFSEKMRALGHVPYDVFNHTGNVWIGIVGGFAASFVAANAQVGFANMRGTQETASTSRINKVCAAAGLVATAAGCYAFEKFGGSVDMLDVVYPLGVGVLSATIIRAELQPDPFANFPRPTEQTPPPPPGPQNPPQV